MLLPQLFVALTIQHLTDGDLQGRREFGYEITHDIGRHIECRIDFDLSQIRVLLVFSWQIAGIDLEELWDLAVWEPYLLQLLGRRSRDSAELRKHSIP